MKRTNMKEWDSSVQSVIMRPHRKETCSFTGRRFMTGLFMLAVSAITKPAQKEVWIYTERQNIENCPGLNWLCGGKKVGWGTWQGTTREWDKLDTLIYDIWYMINGIGQTYSIYNVFTDIFKSTCCTSIWYWANIFHIFSSLPVASQYRIGLMVNEPPVTTSPPKLSSCLERKVRRMMMSKPGFDEYQICIRMNIRI